MTSDISSTTCPAILRNWTVDAHHEVIGSRWLAQRFRPEVSEPVRLHVPAKRYLLATDADYFAKLSPASVITLKLQGGPMSAHEVSAFETERFFREAGTHPTLGRSGQDRGTDHPRPWRLP